MSDCMTKKENPQPSQACKYVGSYIADFTAKSSTTSKYKICGKELRLSGNTFNLIDISPIIICMDCMAISIFSNRYIGKS